MIVSDVALSHLALEGTEITRQVLNPASTQMHVKRADKTGTLEFAVEGENIKVTYTVERVKKEISTGVMGAVTGAGLGSILGNHSGICDNPYEISSPAVLDKALRTDMFPLCRPVAPGLPIKAVVTPQAVH